MEQLIGIWKLVEYTVSNQESGWIEVWPAVGQLIYAGSGWMSVVIRIDERYIAYAGGWRMLEPGLVVHTPSVAHPARYEDCEVTRKVCINSESSELRLTSVELVNGMIHSVRWIRKV